MRGRAVTITGRSLRSGIPEILEEDYCTRCGSMEELNIDRQCYDCYAEMCEDSLNEFELEYVQHKTSGYIKDLTVQMWRQLKANPRRFKYTMAPFSVASLHTLRRYLLYHHEGITLEEVRQTKGQRGGAQKQWVLRVVDTASFQALVKLGFPKPNLIVHGSARAFTNTLMSAWVPPLIATLTSTDAQGEENTSCTWTMVGGTVTGHGFSFSAGFDYAPTHLALTKRYLAVHVARLQTWRAERARAIAVAPEDQEGGVEMVELLSQALLLRIAPHLG